MKTKEEVLNLVYQSIDEVNEQNDLSIAKDAETKLFGSNSCLDSLGLVNLIVTIEEKINTEFNSSIVIADDRAMSQKNSPFKNIATITDYILILLNE